MIFKILLSFLISVQPPTSNQVTTPAIPFTTAANPYTQVNTIQYGVGDFLVAIQKTILIGRNLHGNADF